MNLGQGRPYWIRAYQMFLFLVVFTWLVFGGLAIFFNLSDAYIDLIIEWIRENQLLSWIITIALFGLFSFIGIWKKEAHGIAQFFQNGPLMAVVVILIIPIFVFFTPILMFGLVFKHAKNSFKKKESGKWLTLPLPLIVITFMIFTIWVLVQIDAT